MEAQVNKKIGVGVSGRGGGSMGEIPVFETGKNKRRDTAPCHIHMSDHSSCALPARLQTSSASPYMYVG
jgi:hypothetical protein